MADEIIIDIKIPKSEIDAAVQSISNLRGRVEALRKENKELDKSSEAYTKNALEIKALNQEISQNERVLTANTKAQKANEGSVTQLRKQLSVVSQQWADLSKEERENTEAGRKLGQQKLELSDRLKVLEKATGDTRRNVGNYSEGMREALQSTNVLGQGTNNLFNLMKANPIMLLVSLFVSLGQKVSAAQSIMDSLNKVLQPINIVFQRMIGLIQELIEGGFARLGEILRDPIGAIKNLGKEMRTAAQEGQRLAEITIQIEEAQNKLILTEGKLRRELEQQRGIAADLSKTQEERQEAAEGALRAIEQLEAARLEVLNKEIEAAEIKAKQNDTDRKTQAELNRLLAQRDEILADTARQSREVVSQLNTINEQEKRDNEAKHKAMLKAHEDRLKAEEEQAKEAAQRREEQQAAERTRLNEQFLLGLKEQLIAGEITRDEYNARILEKELQQAEALLAIQKSLGLNTLETETQIADLRIQQMERVSKAKVEADKAQEVASKEQMKLESEVAKNEEQLVSQTSELAKAAAGEDAEAQKAVAVVQSGVNTSLAVTRALAQGGPIQASIVAALGALQISKIISAEVPRFAEGVIGLEGAGTGTSDSIDAKLSRGESVMTAKSTKVFAPVLGLMEQMVGNKPNFQIGSGRFAKGIINAGAAQSRIASSAGGLNMAEALSKVKIYTSVTEFDEVSSRLNRARNKAQFVE